MSLLRRIFRRPPPPLPRRIVCDCGNLNWRRIEVVASVAKLGCPNCGHVRLVDHRRSRPIRITRTK